MKVSGVSTNPLASALMAAKEETKKHALKVTVVDEILPPSGSMNTQYGMWNINNDLNKPVQQFSKSNVPTLHMPELDKWLALIQGTCKQSLASLHWEQDLQVMGRNCMDAAGLLCILLQP